MLVIEWLLCMFQEVEALNEAKGILITQKVELQNKLDGMDDKIKQVCY